MSRAINPLYRNVVETYFAPTGFEVVELPVGADGRTNLSGLGDLGELAGVALQSPNFFGCIEDLEAAGQKIHSDKKTLFVTAFSEPLAYGMLKNPGDCGADIACGEGQSFGIPQSFGGPGLGMFAAKQRYVRTMPGRLIGKTVDRDGKTGFVLTLATREQHIRREKATSNICSNQGLCATASTMYMAALGVAASANFRVSTATGPSTSNRPWPKPGSRHRSARPPSMNSLSVSPMDLAIPGRRCWKKRLSPA